jgi:hypothetical protein
MLLAPFHCLLHQKLTPFLAMPPSAAHAIFCSCAGPQSRPCRVSAREEGAACPQAIRGSQLIHTAYFCSQPPPPLTQSKAFASYFFSNGLRSYIRPQPPLSFPC